MKGVDSNLLVYAFDATVPQHRAARAAIAVAREGAQGWGIPLPCLAEFWNVVTHARSAGGPATASSARAFIAALTEADAAIWLPGKNFAVRLMDLAVELNIQGPRIVDLQIALTARDNGATEIWTHDAGFVAIPGLRVFNPLAK
jgi:predicted nucleic acid-binding protein